MRKIAELTMLLRGRVELPDDLNLVTEEFQEGWSFVQSGDTHWLDKEIRRRGWHFMWIGEGITQRRRRADIAGSDCRRTQTGSSPCKRALQRGGS